MARIKVCGNLYAMDAHMVASYEPDYMGWIFVPSSRRRISPDKAIRIIRSIRQNHPGIQHVAVMGGMGLDEMVRLLKLLLVRYLDDRPSLDLDAIQIIGSSQDIYRMEQFLRGQGIELPMWPVVHVGAPVTDEDLKSLASAQLYLLDRKVTGALGGTGKEIPESWIQDVQLPYMLAGGINPENARHRLLNSHAMGVDIASGLETGVPGRKDPARLDALFASLADLRSSVK